MADCVKAGSKQPINQKAVETLSDIWEKHATFHTFYLVILEDKPDEPYYMVVVNTVVDCIDREKPVGEVNDFEDHEKYGYFLHIDQWAFREEEIGGNVPFVLPDNSAAIYATETFKQRVIDAEPKGFGLIKQMFNDPPLFCQLKKLCRMQTKGRITRPFFIKNSTNIRANQLSTRSNLAILST